MLIYESPKLSVWILLSKHFFFFFFNIALMNKTNTSNYVPKKKKTGKMGQNDWLLPSSHAVSPPSPTLKPNRKFDAELK